MDRKVYRKERFYMNEIEEWYDNKYDEWLRLDRHRVEFEITMRYMDEFIKGEELDILDIGGGPGRYSIYLAGKGHKLTLFDLSGKNLEVAKEKSKEYEVTLEGYIKGNVLDVQSFEKKFDVVLFMGPMYHLIKLEERKQALLNVLRYLKDGGIIITSFISNYAVLQDYLLSIDQCVNVEDAIKYLKDGVNQENEGFTTAYFVGIEEAQEFMNSFGIEQLAFAGVENILCSKEHDILALPEEDIKKWLEIAYVLSQDKNLLGTSCHFLHIGKK